MNRRDLMKAAAAALGCVVAPESVLGAATIHVHMKMASEVRSLLIREGCCYVTTVDPNTRERTHLIVGDETFREIWKRSILDTERDFPFHGIVTEDPWRN